MDCKVLAIYLPQFHVIPENDDWWGKGFTEWTNVRRGKPFYPGHYQPREPLYDNYYDLSDLSVLEKHTRMARKANISGFCFYHYYFCGKKLLEKPIENYRDHSKEKYPYCLIWANQSWTRTWYRAATNNAVMMQQTYGGEKEWEKHFYYLLEFFKDDRYIKIDNKPLYIIYIPQDISYRRQMFSFWDRLAKENGFCGIYLVAMNTSYGGDKKGEFYDAFLDFEPLSLFRNDCSWRKYVDEWKLKMMLKSKWKKSSLYNRLWSRDVYTYSYLCKIIEKKAKKNVPDTFSGIFAGWDNTSRKDEEGIIVRGSTPLKFQRHIIKMLKIAEKNKKEYIFLNAWNEWSEGAYVEPDKHYGYAYLNAIKKAVNEYRKGKV